MSDCLFCKIVNKEIPSEAVYEDEFVYAFHDISPVATIHIIVIPKKHIKSLNDIEENDLLLMGKILSAINKIAKDKKIDSEGYRVVNNCGENGGQTVDHIHFHLLGGRNMMWPPG
ncbi:histidine triad (HIT) family protein [Desulfonispora thiosulfatigenes DSM 11270]|uniref:Histidine triad (HIT) family protein n=1 Tax=Desulfonispora thiosulfatigenes DSM 11270 TaxID=656914 RepID=A0A1W1VC80_DESTI|nr:histidine triad nucleotide-binding protein [Desulfonispora thiosulfatigenes]SMB90925.1 histidine triad (HIT) family protein [Desulfonispora thiosulfatigenes DSM 11270]